MSEQSIGRLTASALLVFFVSVSSLAAQALPPAPGDTAAAPVPVTTPTEKPVSVPALKKDDFLGRGFARQLLQDEKSMWSSPAHIKASDLKWIAPLAGGTAVLFMKDNQISHHFDQDSSLQNKSLKVSKIGQYATWGVPGAFLAFGKMTHNERMADTGEKGFQAALYSTIAMQGLKFLTNRTRPYLGGDGHFFNGGNSFPSGHSMEAWALAKVVSDEYSDKRLVKIGMYSFATAVSLSRITSQRHYASDVLVGSALGYLIGKFVMRDHHPQPVQAQ